MNEISYVIIGLIMLTITAIFLALTDTPEQIEDTDINIIIALGIGLLIMILDRRQDRHIHEIIKTQNKIISEIHVMIKEEKIVLEEIKNQFK